MELDQCIPLWRGRASEASVIGASSCVSRDGNRLVLLTSSKDVREICARTRKCVHHWTFGRDSSHALHVAAVRHPHSRVLYGICGSPGVSASKKARQARRQEARKTSVLPANEGITVWQDTDVDVASWKRVALQSTAKVFALLAHVKLKEEVVVVFQDGSFATYDSELKRGVQRDDGKESGRNASRVEEGDGTNERMHVLWAFLETNSPSSLKGALFLSMLVQKTGQKVKHDVELWVYQMTIPTVTRRMGGVLSVDLRVRHRISWPDDQEISACAFHPETFSYSLVGRLGYWYSLRFARDALTNKVTLAASQHMPNLALSNTVSKMPVHKKRKLQAESNMSSGHLVSGVGHASFLVALELDAPLTLTVWDSNFAVPVSKAEISLPTEKEHEESVLLRCSINHGVGKAVQFVQVGAGDAIIVVFERAVFLLHVRNKHSSLASVLGATAFTDGPRSESTAMPDSSVPWEDVIARGSEMLDAETWKSTMCREDDRERQLIADLLDPQVTATSEEFQNRLAQALNDQKRQRKTGPDENAELSYRLCKAVIRRCLESSDLGLWAPLEKMIRTKRVSARAEPTLLPLLMQQNQVALLECAIAHLMDIDELSIVRLLKYFVRQSTNSVLLKFVTQQVTTTTSETSRVDAAIAALDRYTRSLLSLPVNRIFLHRAVRELALEEVLLVLAMCKKLLLVHLTGDNDAANAKDDEALPNGKNASKKASVPSASQCCTWISVLLDAHVAALVHRASQHAPVARALHELDTLVQMVLRTHVLYESVHGVLSNFLSGLELPQAPGLPDYCVEELRL
ncbi:hypothetical protein PsorP6_016252 [Peronosclerospora sorghi]|uniref:Uncharacterized protein n=1 Tax=Peronosclerospora sorghi TaxID=230839 RepID=A0ACC0VR31_9STRA|nr:hypothetical protein PsorP6_016252 [Peronosclerospora sorghi]